MRRKPINRFNSNSHIKFFNSSIMPEFKFEPVIVEPLVAIPYQVEHSEAIEPPMTPCNSPITVKDETEETSQETSDSNDFPNLHELFQIREELETKDILPEIEDLYQDSCESVQQLSPETVSLPKTVPKMSLVVQQVLLNMKKAKINGWTTS